MADGGSKIFIWQLVLAAVVGLVWFLLWEVPSSETGFFVDLPWGLLIGFLVGLVVVLGLAVIVGLVWTLIRQVQSSGAGFSGAMDANLDQMAGSSAMSGVNQTLTTWKSSGVVWGVGWVLGVAVLWGVAGGLVWGFELDFVVTIVIALVSGAVGGLVITGLVHATDELTVSIGQGYGWLDSPLSSLRIGPGLGGAIAWGLAGLLAAGGLGAGIGEDIVLAAVAFIAAVAAGVIGAQLRASMDAK